MSVCLSQVTRRIRHPTEWLIAFSDLRQRLWKVAKTWQTREMVSMSGDRQRSASTSVVQQEVNANKDSPSASTSSTTAAAATNNSIKDKKMASNSSAVPTSHATSNSSAHTAAAAAASASGSNGIVPVSGPVNSSTTAARRAPANAANPAEQGQLHNEESPNHIVYRKVYRATGLYTPIIPTAPYMPHI